MPFKVLIWLHVARCDLDRRPFNLRIQTFYSCAWLYRNRTFGEIAASGLQDIVLANWTWPHRSTVSEAYKNS